ncbi:MAG: hypothetical protein PHS86_13680 [Syntrophaceae bacterium]|nr:hypothetical protein [Syntrophaceae bacterium]
MKEPYFSSIDGTLVLDEIPINAIHRRSRERNAELRKFARFMANGSHSRGSIHQFEDDGPLGLLNQGKIRSVIYEGAEIPLPDIESLKKESYVVYDDTALDSDQVVDILNVKASLSHRFLHYLMKLNLVTMMLPSYIFDRDDDGAVHMEKIKIINYTYLNFNNFSHSLDDSMRQNVTSMIRLNLLTVCYESLQQKKRLPFLINPPGAFIRSLNDKQKEAAAQIISDSVSEVGNDRQIQGIVENGISEWILLNPDFWVSRPVIPHMAHCVKADVCQIALELWKKHGALCPVPMMGAPTGAIGNGALGNHAEKALDEFLFRACGGIHGLAGNLRYNPDIKIRPLSQIMARLAIGNQ